MAKVSIVIPVYNSAKYIKQCLESLLNQTLSDFEVICVNDGSKDNSLEILNEYAKKDSRFTVINKINEGQGIARNLAIDKASGEVLLCLDSDDWLESNALELAYNKIKKDNCDVLFVDAYRYIEVSEKKYLLRYTDPFKNFKNKIFTPKEAGKNLFRVNGLPFKFYNLDYIKKNNIKYSSHRFLEDIPFFIKALINAKYLSCLSTPIYNYRVTENSASSNYEKYFSDIPPVYDCCFDIIKNSIVDKDILKSVLENRKNSLIYFYGQIPFRKKYAYYKMFKKIIQTHFEQYGLDEELERINSSNFFKYWLTEKFRKTKIALQIHQF